MSVKEITYPKNLRELTDEQIFSSLEFFTSLSITNLRKRQKIANEQSKIAFQNKNEIAKCNIAIIIDMLTASIHWIFYPEDATIKDWVQDIHRIIKRLKEN